MNLFTTSIVMINMISLNYEILTNSLSNLLHSLVYINIVYKLETVFVTIFYF